MAAGGAPVLHRCNYSRSWSGAARRRSFFYEFLYRRPPRVLESSLHTPTESVHSFTRRGIMRLPAAVVLAALVVVCLAGEVLGQGFQGGLRGAIKDSGGVVPGVEVTLTNEQTNIKRSVVTNERGEYSFANVDPGTYAVKAALQGYKTIDRTGIRVGTQQFFTLDLTLEVGAIEENVTVTGQSPLIETGNASQGTVLDSEALQTLPAPGRAAFLIGVSIPTVVPSGDGQYNRQQDQ